VFSDSKDRNSLGAFEARYLGWFWMLVVFLLVAWRPRLEE
jgi:hypothetical protein